GGGSSLYGSGALSGVVNLIPRRASHNFFAAEASIGSESALDLSLADNIQIHRWDLSASGEAFRTKGYVDVPAAQRGTIDTPVNSNHGEARVVARRSFNRGYFFTAGEFY